MREIDRYLDWMDRTRAMRTQERPELWMMDGFRADWNKYVAEWVEDNSDRG